MAESVVEMVVRAQIIEAIGLNRSRLLRGAHALGDQGDRDELSEQIGSNNAMVVLSAFSVACRGRPGATLFP